MAVLNFDATQVELPAHEEELIDEFIDAHFPNRAEVRQAMTPHTARAEDKYVLPAEAPFYPSTHGQEGRMSAWKLVDNSERALSGCELAIDDFLETMMKNYLPNVVTGVPEHEVGNATWRLAVALRKKIHSRLEILVAGVRTAKKTHVVSPAPPPTSGDPVVTSTLPKRGPGRPRKTAATAPAVTSEPAEENGSEIVGAVSVDEAALAEALGITL